VSTAPTVYGFASQPRPSGDGRKRCLQGRVRREQGLEWRIEGGGLRVDRLRCEAGGRQMTAIARPQLPEPTTVGGDNEQEATDRKQDASDDIPRPRKLEGGDLRSNEPDAGDQDEQEPDFGNAHAGLMRP
jgi:hypothetical protein